MSANPLLDRARAYTDDQIEARLRRCLANAVDAIGPGTAAGAIEANRSDLRQALDGAPSRKVQLGWIVPLLRLASTDDRMAFLAELLAPLGLEAVSIQRRSMERRLLDLEAAVAEECGASGRRVVDAERNRP